MIAGGIIVPPGSRRNTVRIVSNRVRPALDDFSPWKGMIYDCGKRGPRLSSLESLDRAARKGLVTGVRLFKTPFGTKESDAVWERCQAAEHGGCGSFARAVRSAGLKRLTQEAPSPSEFIANTAAPELAFSDDSTPEALYRSAFSSASADDLQAGKFSRVEDLRFTQGVFIGWVVESGVSKQILSRLEGGAVTHVFWIWWVG